MNEYLEKVKRFHETFGLPVKDNPDEITTKDFKLRINLLVEELDELKEAFFKREAAIEDGVDHKWQKETLDALCDLQYVLSGAILQLGYSKIFDEAFSRVHESNMSKSIESFIEAETEVNHLMIKGIKCKAFLTKDRWVIKRLPDGKILKPSGYSPVSFRGLL